MTTQCFDKDQKTNLISSLPLILCCQATMLTTSKLLPTTNNVYFLLINIGILFTNNCVSAIVGMRRSGFPKRIKQHVPIETTKLVNFLKMPRLFLEKVILLLVYTLWTTNCSPLNTAKKNTMLKKSIC